MQREDVEHGGSYGTRDAVLTPIQWRPGCLDPSAQSMAFTIGSADFQVNPALLVPWKHSTESFNCEIKVTFLRSEIWPYANRIMMAYSTNTDPFNAKKSSSGARRTSMPQPKRLWGYVLCGIFSVTVRKNSLKRACSMSTFFHCSAHGQC